MRTDHEQIPFVSLYGKECTVDTGMFDILTVLKNLGVFTQYSCENNDGQGYILATTKSARRLEKIAKRLYSDGKLSLDASIIVRRFLNGNREVDFHYNSKEAYREYTFTLRYRKSKSRYIIERQYSLNYGSRTTYRWPIQDSARLLRTLQEIETSWMSGKIQPN